MSRPLDALEAAKGKRVLVKLKEGGDLVGTLKAFDLHINLWVDDAQRINGETTTKLGTVIIRGDNILLVSPE